MHNRRIGIAVSGGKDSTVALHMIHDIFSQRSQVDLYALTVDEGIQGYREKSIPFAQKHCRLLGVEHHIISFQEVVGKTMDEIAAVHDDLGECSYCGVFRRVCLNNKAKELQLDELVTGHNLDDMAQSVLMNFVNGDMQKLARLGPHEKVQPGFVPRRLPLRVIPEKEVMLYAILKNIEFYHGECPYSTRALRGDFRAILEGLEENHPGTRHSILNSYETLKDFLVEKYPPITLHPCDRCGEPTSQRRCKACVLLDRLQQK